MQVICIENENAKKGTGRLDQMNYEVVLDQGGDKLATLMYSDYEDDARIMTKALNTLLPIMIKKYFPASPKGLSIIAGKMQNAIRDYEAYLKEDR